MDSITIDNAIKLLLNLVYKLNNFGVKLFPILFSNGFEIKGRKKDSNRLYYASTGPNGIVISLNGKHVLSLSYDCISQFKIFIDCIHIIMEYEVKKHFFEIKGVKSIKIYKLIRQYKTVLIPLLKQRQSLYIFDKDIDELKTKNNPNLSHIYTKELLKKSNKKVNLLLNKEIPDIFYLYVSRQLDHPSPNLFNFSIDYNAKEVADVGLYYLTIPNRNSSLEDISNYTIITSNKRNIDNSKMDVKYAYMQPLDHLKNTTFVDEKSSIFIVENNPLAQVIIPNNQSVFERRYNIINNIKDICKEFCDDLNLGSHLGYTLYETLNFERDGNHYSKELPLDFLHRIPEETSNYVELVLKRRFYLFTKNILNNEKTLNNSYEDIKEMFINDHISLTKQTKVLDKKQAYETIFNLSIKCHHFDILIFPIM